MANKGSPFEREVSVELSMWWSRGATEDIFWRRDSGARAKRRSREGKNTFGAHGDICAIDPIGLPLTEMVTLELKRGYKKWSVMDILDRPAMKKNQKNETKQVFETFMEQVEEDAEAAGTYPVIIAKRDKRSKIIILPKRLFNHIERKMGKYKLGTKLTIEHDLFKYTMIAISFYKFLEWCHPNYFINESSRRIYNGIRSDKEEKNEKKEKKK